MQEEDRQQFSFNIQAELYENDFGDLAIRFEGDRVYTGIDEAGRFQDDARHYLVDNRMPAGWRDLSPRELLYGRNWHCVSRLGYIDGNPDRPGVEFEVAPDALGSQARAYLNDLLA